MKVRSHRDILSEQRRVARMINEGKTNGIPPNVLLGAMQALSWCLFDKVLVVERRIQTRAAGRKTAGRKR